jgi:AbiV family abortive infection protein
MAKHGKKRETAQGLAPDFLVEGSVHALEQCGLLLTAAAALIEQRLYPTAVGLALLALEELGRHRILLRDLWPRSVSGTTVTLEDVERACQADHVAKQRHGQSSLTNRFQSGDQRDGIMRKRISAEPGSDERRKADEQQEYLDERQWSRQPRDRHQTRMRALYVDIRDDGQWSKPSDLDPLDCADQVEDAINEYCVAVNQMQAPRDEAVARAIAALASPPQFPPRPLISAEARTPPSRRTP